MLLSLQSFTIIEILKKKKSGAIKRKRRVNKATK